MDCVSQIPRLRGCRKYHRNGFCSQDSSNIIKN